jgi:hypothetical protein
MTEAEQAVGSNPSSDIKDIVVMVVCVAIILAGMAWFMTYDWPSGKRPSVGEFILFWLRELIVLGFLFAVFCVLVVQRLTRRKKT